APGAAGLRRRPSARGAPGTAARRPPDLPEPVTCGARPQRPADSSSDQHAPETSTTRTPSTTGESRTVSGGTPEMAPARFGEKCAPRTTSGKSGCLPEPVKGAYGVAARSATPPLDRARPTGRSSRHG